MEEENMQKYKAELSRIFYADDKKYTTKFQIETPNLLLIFDVVFSRI